MKASTKIKDDLFLWIDSVLSQDIPENTVAFHFNLYEGSDSVHVQLMGTDSFEGGADYWPGEETFSTGEAIFEIPFTSAGAEWPEWLEFSKQLVIAYIDSGGKSTVFRRSRGVGIGFVDGDMYVLWPKSAA